MIFTSYFKIYNYSANTFTVTSAETSGWTAIVIKWSPISLIGPSGSCTSLLSISISIFVNASEISLVPTEPYNAPSSVTGTAISQACEIAVPVTEEGALYGSVGTREISEAFTNIDIEIDKSEVQLPDGPIKEIGDHLITIAVHPEVSAEVTVKVLAE